MFSLEFLDQVLALLAENYVLFTMVNKYLEDIPVTGIIYP